VDIVKLKKELETRLSEMLHSPCLNHLSNFYLRTCADYCFVLYKLDCGASYYTSLMRLREYKIREMDITYEEFEKLYQIDSLEALRLLLCYPLTLDHICHVNSNNVRKIFEYCKQAPRVHPLRIIFQSST